MKARVALVAFLVLLRSATAAADYRFAVLPLQPDSAANREAADTLRSAISRRLPSSMPLVEVDRRLGVADPTCTSAKCLGEAARLLSAHLMLGGRVGRTESGEWTLSLWLFNADERATVATHRDQCGSCDLEQASAWAGKVARHLINSAGRAEASARLEVRSTPPGGAVSIDGSAVGVSGMTFGVSAGRHTVSVQLEGHTVAAREVDLAPGKLTVVELELVPTASTAPAAPDRPRPAPGFFSARVFKWVTLGVAVGGLAAGISLIVIDGQPTCDETFPNMECPEVRDTLAAGAVLTALGGAAGLASGYLFYLDARDGGRSAAVAPTLMPGGVGLTATLRY